MSKWIILDHVGNASVCVAERFFDAREQASRLLAIVHPGVKLIFPFDAVETTDEASEDSQLEWRGHDAGPHPDRKLWMRQRPREGARQWSEWTPVGG